MGLLVLPSAFIQNCGKSYVQPKVSSVVKHKPIGAGGLRFDSRAGQIKSARRVKCDVSSEVCR